MARRLALTSIADNGKQQQQHRPHQSSISLRASCALSDACVHDADHQQQQQSSLDSVTPEAVKCMILSYLPIRSHKCSSVMNTHWLRASKRPESKGHDAHGDIFAFNLHGVFHVTPTAVESIPWPTARLLCSATRVDNDCIIITGGNKGGNIATAVEQYDHSTRRWSELPSMLTSRFRHKCVTLKNPLRVMVICGDDSAQTCEIYDVVAKKWSSAASLLKCQGLPVSIVYENKVYVFGVQTCEVYDEKKNSWCMIADRPIIERWDESAVVGQVILVMGGVNSNYGVNDNYSDTIEEYTPLTDKWRTLSWKLPQPRGYFGASYNSTTGILMICGGCTHKANMETNVYLRGEPLESNEWQLCDNVTLDTYINSGYGCWC